MYLLAVFAPITFKEASLFEVDSFSCAHAAAFDTLLYIARRFQQGMAV